MKRPDFRPVYRNGFLINGCLPRSVCSSALEARQLTGAISVEDLKKGKDEMEFSPIKRNGFIINGCLPSTPRSESVEARQVAESRSLDFLWEKSDDMPAVRWDDALENYLDKRGDESDLIREKGICIFPWVVIGALPKKLRKSGLLYYSQGKIGSCMAHSDAFGCNSAKLSAIAKGIPLVYSPVNPIVGFWLSKGKSLSGGQTVSEMVDFSNKTGRWLNEWVGDDNQTVPRNYDKFFDDAAKNQAGYAYLPGNGDELVQNILRVCRADGAVSFGNSLAVSGCKIDRNGVKVATLGGWWAHATHLTQYRKVGRTEYVFWVNSHGPIYKGSTEGDPDDGCWMDLDTLCAFAESIPDYGQPYMHFVEGEIADVTGLRVDFDLNFPNGFKR